MAPAPRDDAYFFVRRSHSVFYLIIMLISIYFSYTALFFYYTRRVVYTRRYGTSYSKKVNGENEKI